MYFKQLSISFLSRNYCNGHLHIHAVGVYIRISNNSASVFSPIITAMGICLFMQWAFTYVFNQLNISFLPYNYCDVHLHIHAVGIYIIMYSNNSTSVFSHVIYHSDGAFPNSRGVDVNMYIYICTQTFVDQRFWHIKHICTTFVDQCF